MELWIAIRHTYADAQAVGVAASEAEAKRLVREAYWADYPDDDRTLDPLDDWTTGSTQGPFTLGQLRKDY